MSNLLESFVVYADEASRSSRNLSSAAWAIFNPSGELVSFRGVCIGRSTNNIVEYSALIELLSDAITHGITPTFRQARLTTRHTIAHWYLLRPKSSYLSHVPKGRDFGKTV